MMKLLFQSLGSFAVLLEEGGDAVVKYSAALFCCKHRGSCSREGRSFLLRRGYCFLSNGGVRGEGWCHLNRGGGGQVGCCRKCD